MIDRIMPGGYGDYLIDCNMPGKSRLLGHRTGRDLSLRILFARGIAGRTRALRCRGRVFCDFDF